MEHRVGQMWVDARQEELAQRFHSEPTLLHMEVIEVRERWVKLRHATGVVIRHPRDRIQPPRYRLVKDVP